VLVHKRIDNTPNVSPYDLELLWGLRWSVLYRHLRRLIPREDFIENGYISQENSYSISFHI